MLALIPHACPPLANGCACVRQLNGNMFARATLLQIFDLTLMQWHVCP